MTDNLLCPWDAPTWLFFSENVPSLLFYSHFTAILAVVIIGGLLFLRNGKNLAVRFLSIVFLIFIFWSIIDVIIWATNRSDIVLFLWSLQVLSEPVIYLIAFYALYAFSYNRIPGFTTNLLVSIILLPLILFNPSYINLSGINLYDCNATEGPLASVYSYVLEVLFILAIISTTLRKTFSLENKKDCGKIIFFALGLLAFLIAFSSGNIIGSVTGNWDLAQYGLFGMPIFVGFLTYLIVEY